MPTLTSTPALTQRSLFKPETLEKKMAVCAGGVSLTPEDRVEVLAILAADPDPSVAERALNVLLTQPVDYFIKALERSDSDPLLFCHCAEKIGNAKRKEHGLENDESPPTSANFLGIRWQRQRARKRNANDKECRMNKQK